MATNTDRIAQLEAAVSDLRRTEAVREVRFEQELALLRVELRHQAETHLATREEMAKLKAENDALRAADAERGKQLAVVEVTVREVKATSEKWGVRWWQLGSGVVLALVGGVIGYLLKR